MRKIKMLSLMVMLFACQIVWAQTKEVTGKVLDQGSNTPLAGVTVSAKGGTEATTTDASGNFTLRVPTQTRALVFSYVGFGEIESPITAGAMSINMSAGATQIEEVVVTGYTTIARKKFSGAISSGCQRTTGRKRNCAYSWYRINQWW